MIKNIFFTILAVMLLTNMTFAQQKTDQRTPATRIADLLAQLPARDAKQLQGNMQEISALGEAGYLTLISGLTGPGKSNNALLEYAIGGYSAYASQKGQEEARKMSVKAYGKALSQLTDQQNKSFIISQLELVGQDDAVPFLQKFLTDQQLADPASRALVKINSPASKKALMNGLHQATGAAQLSLIKALGDSRNKEAAPAIHAWAVASNQDLAKVSLAALAHIADPSSEAVMAAAAKKSGYLSENTNATASNLVYAEMLFGDGNRTLAHKIAKELSEKAVSDNQVYVRTAALKILAESAPENGSSFLLEAMKDKNMEYRLAALKFAVPYLTPATTKLWLDQLAHTDANNQAEVLNMLGQHGVKEALPAALKLLKSKDQQVRLAAISAAGKIGQEQALDNLLKVMRKGDATEIEAVSQAILQMKGNGIPEKIADFIPKAKPNVQVALVNILASRGANAQLSTIYSLLKNKNPEVKMAAFAALKQTVTVNDLPQLFNLLKQTADQTELAEVQDAVIAAVKGSKDNSAQVDAVLQQMAAAPEGQKNVYYKILASLGGEKALKAVSDAFYMDNAQNKQAALAALASWTDAGAGAELLKISRASNNPEQLQLALDGYLRLVRMTDYTAEQRLLRLREAMAVAKTTAQKQLILKDLAQAKTFNAMVFAGKYLDDAAIQQTAANAVMTIALASKYQGTIVKDLLNKTIAVLKGGDSEYEKEAIRKFLLEMPKEGGFVSMFNGLDLNGWKGLVADPIKRAAMDAKTLAVAQEKADAEMRESWKVANGELNFASKGNNLATIKKYGDFEMLVDWKIIDDKKQKGDAGIYLRGTPQVQIWDNARVKDGAQVGSGGLYNNQVNESKPLKVADNKLDEWNTFRILMKGDRVTVYLNGVLVTDNVILENYWDRNMAIFAEEQIELQAHGSPVAYRDLFIREIPRVKPFELSAQEKKEGYKVLFDGTNMHSWTGNTTDYIIEEGNIAIRPKPGKGSGGNLFTKDEYSDFVFRFEFQLTPGANNGLGIRAPFKGDAAYEGMELQILDNDAPIYKDLHVYQYHGSIYGTIPAKRGFLKPVGEWNVEEVIVKGPKIKVILNGTQILDADITEARKNGAADGKPHPGLLRESGHIGFLGHGSPVQFRHIRIKDLSKVKSAI